VGHLKFARFRVAKEHELNWSPHGVFIQDHQPPPIMNFAIIFCCKRRAQCLERGQQLFPSLRNFSITQPQRERERERERERFFSFFYYQQPEVTGTMQKILSRSQAFMPRKGIPVRSRGTANFVLTCRLVKYLTFFFFNNLQGI
jgi:hypothetical protein